MAGKTASIPGFCRNGGPDDGFALERGLWRQGIQVVAGVDEAGRGPLAGPVVAGCVILPPDCRYHRFQDSKKLSPSRREELFAYLHSCGARLGTGIVSARIIEKINILQASLQAMQAAVLDCASDRNGPDYLLVDGKFQVPLPLAQQTLIKGESRSSSIAAASILAKVTRDRIMARLHDRFPQYNFIRNQGYPTQEHREAIARYGPCEAHRRTFKGVREYVCGEQPDSSTQPSLW